MTAHRPDRPIALVGLMGAGKSSVGRLLAERLRLPFVDTDEQIEAESGHSIGDIFARDGEDHFRAIERQVTACLAAGPPRVIATGGGAFLDDRTRALLLARCTVVWLDADVDTLADRISQDGSRPLLRDKEPRALLADLARRRNPIYARAHLRIQTGANTTKRVAERIMRALNSLQTASRL